MFQAQLVVLLATFLFIATTYEIPEQDILPFEKRRNPVLGPKVTNGTKPLFGYSHKGTDAIFALACNYPALYYRRFVGSLRKVGYEDDIVLAVSPVNKQKPGVEAYLQETHVIAYPFEVDCKGKDNCRFKDDFLGYPDPRPYRTFANIRYALYEYWLLNYHPKSMILILDFRDTYFQLPVFQTYPTWGERDPNFYDLQLYAENRKVKWLGKCVYNSMWVSRCFRDFDKDALKRITQEAVICSGSTLGTFNGIDYYVMTMLKWFDKIQCWKKGIESDQGYQNYLFYNKHFDTANGKANLNYQGIGVVNTIGAMNGFRVPKDQKGRLDTFWKIKDSEGYILNNDGTRSACVHQWDRFYAEIQHWLDITFMQIPGAKNESKSIELRERNRLKKIELKKKAAEMEKQLKTSNEGGFGGADVTNAATTAASIPSNEGGFVQSVSTVIDNKMAGSKASSGKVKPLKSRPLKSKASKMIDMV